MQKSNSGAINRVFTAQQAAGMQPNRRKTAPLMVVGVLEDNEPVRSAGAQKRRQKYPGIGAFRGAA